LSQNLARLSIADRDGQFTRIDVPVTLNVEPAHHGLPITVAITSYETPESWLLGLTEDQARELLERITVALG
jgi:hypothetical protein